MRVLCLIKVVCVNRLFVSNDVNKARRGSVKFYTT